MVKQPERPRTVEQVRDDIDSGRTGDKVPAADPAAAPLGTDDEAAGESAPTEPRTGARENREPGAVRAHSLATGRSRTMRVAVLAAGGVALLIALALVIGV